MNRLMMLAASALAMVSARAELPKDVTDNVPSELTEGFDLVYKSDIPVGMDWRNGAAVYSIDNRADEAFDRAAFYFQLVSADGTATNWVWIATDKYSAGVSTHELSIPFRGAGTLGRFKLNSAESLVKVASNGPNCDFRNAANPYVLVIESWYSNYNQYRNGEEFGGYDPYFDWNDTFQDVGDGYGCFNFIKVDTDMMNNGVPLLCVNGWGVGRFDELRHRHQQLRLQLGLHAHVRHRRLFCPRVLCVRPQDGNAGRARPPACDADR